MMTDLFLYRCFNLLFKKNLLYMMLIFWDMIKKVFDNQIHLLLKYIEFDKWLYIYWLICF